MPRNFTLFSDDAGGADLVLSSVVTLTGEYEVRFKVFLASAPSNAAVMAGHDTGNEFIGVFANGSIALRDTNSSQRQSSAGVFPFGQLNEIRITRSSGGNAEIFINDTLVTSGPNTGDFKLLRLGDYKTLNLGMNGYLADFEVYLGGTLTHRWAIDSDGTGAIENDSVGTNHATRTQLTSGDTESFTLNTSTNPDQWEDDATETIIMPLGYTDAGTPVLSSPSAIKVWDFGYQGSVTTDVGNGTLYYYISQNSTETSATIEANGTSVAVTQAGAISVEGYGLSASTVYYLHFFHVATGDLDSNVVSSAQFTTDAQTNFSVIALAGQSNMIGRPTLVPGTDDVYAGTNQAIQYAYTAQSLMLAKNTLDHADEQAGDMGLWLTCVNKFITDNQFTKPIMLVPVAAGGTGFIGNNWNQGNGSYINAVNRINAAMATRPGNTLEAILWHQGESDATTAGVAAYQANITAMHAAMITDITAMTVDTPFILGHIATTANPTESAAINDEIDTFSASLNFSAVVQTNDLTLEDTVHFNAASLRTMGTRYAAAYQQTLNTLGIRITEIYEPNSAQLVADSSSVNYAAFDKFPDGTETLLESGSDGVISSGDFELNSFSLGALSSTGYLFLSWNAGGNDTFVSTQYTVVDLA